MPFDEGFEEHNGGGDDRPDDTVVDMIMEVFSAGVTASDNPYYVSEAVLLNILMTVVLNAGVRDELTEDQAIEYGLKLVNLILTERKDRLADLIAYGIKHNHGTESDE
jgi:hypothetical protein